MKKKDPPPPKKLIKISSQFVELAKDYSKVFAFKWNPLMSNNGSISFGRTNDGGVTSNETGTLSGTISNLFPKLASARNAGYVRIIQSGMVITKEGESAVIKKGQQIPFLATQTQQAVAVQTASVDYTLTVTSPTIVGEDKIDFQKLNVTIQLPIGRGANGAPLTSNNQWIRLLLLKTKRVPLSVELFSHNKRLLTIKMILRGLELVFKLVNQVREELLLYFNY
jgi:pilus assembly protein CpaC